MNSPEEIIKHMEAECQVDPEIVRFLKESIQDLQKNTKPKSIFGSANENSGFLNKNGPYTYVNDSNITQFFNSVNPKLFNHKVENVDANKANAFTSETTKQFKTQTMAQRSIFSTGKHSYPFETIKQVASESFKTISNSSAFDEFKVSYKNKVLPSSNFTTIMEQLISTFTKEYNSKTSKHMVDTLIPMILAIHFIIVEYGCDYNLQGFSGLLIATIDESQEFSTFRYSVMFNNISDQIRDFLINTLGWKHLFSTSPPADLHQVLDDLKLREFQTASTTILFVNDITDFKKTSHDPVNAYNHYTTLTDDLICSRFPLDIDDIHVSAQELCVYSKKLDKCFKTMKEVTAETPEYNEIVEGNKYMRKLIKSLVGRISELHKIVTVRPIIEGILSSPDFKNDGPQIVKELDNDLQKLTIEPKLQSVTDTLEKFTSNRDMTKEISESYSTKTLKFFGTSKKPAFGSSSKETLFQVAKSNLVYCDKCDFKHRPESKCYPKSNMNTISKWDESLFDDFFENDPETMRRIMRRRFRKSPSAQNVKSEETEFFG